MAIGNLGMQIHLLTGTFNFVQTDTVMLIRNYQRLNDSKPN